MRRTRSTRRFNTVMRRYAWSTERGFSSTKCSAASMQRSACLMRRGIWLMKCSAWCTRRSASSTRRYAPSTQCSIPSMRRSASSTKCRVRFLSGRARGRFPCRSFAFFYGLCDIDAENEGNAKPATCNMCGATLADGREGALIDSLTATPRLPTSSWRLPSTSSSGGRVAHVGTPTWGFEFSCRRGLRASNQSRLQVGLPTRATRRSRRARAMATATPTARRTGCCGWGGESGIVQS